MFCKRLVLGRGASNREEEKKKKPQRRKGEKKGEGEGGMRRGMREEGGRGKEEEEEGGGGRKRKERLGSSSFPHSSSVPILMKFCISTKQFSEIEVLFAKKTRRAARQRHAGQCT